MKVSIVIPTFKRPDLLERLLFSIEKQSISVDDYEVIVVDDFSPNYDEYHLVMEKYKTKFKELRFLRNESNRGAPYSRNRGIMVSKYDLIAMVDDDDEWLPLKLEKQIAIFEASDKTLGLVYTWTDVIDAGRVVHQYRSSLEGDLRKQILRDCFIPSPSVMARKTAIVDAGLFDVTFPSCQDWDLWTRVIFKKYKVKVLKEVVTLYHKHGRSSIGLSENALVGYKKYYKNNLRYFLYYWGIIPKFLKSCWPG